jgi:hypothetical protein
MQATRRSLTRVDDSREKSSSEFFSSGERPSDESESALKQMVDSSWISSDFQDEYNSVSNGSE